jgi:hypothetical protein
VQMWCLLFAVVVASLGQVVQTHYVKASANAASNDFGSSAATSFNAAVTAIGAYTDLSGGTVYVFGNQGGSLSQTASFSGKFMLLSI